MSQRNMQRPAQAATALPLATLAHCQEHAYMVARRPHEIFRLESVALLYRMYLLPTGELRFTVTGDNLRLGLLTREDLQWDCSWDLPAMGETTRLTHTHSHPLRVLRQLARHLAQYLAKHRPAYCYYEVRDDARRHRVYLRLLQRHAAQLEGYRPQLDDSHTYLTLTRQ